MKSSQYFSHDIDAHDDEKITNMRMIYKSEGYGWYWIIVETMANQQDYKLTKSKYIFESLAFKCQTTKNKIEKFIHDCIQEFNLFSEDSEKIFSLSLLSRMELKEIKSNIYRQNAMKSKHYTSNSSAIANFKNSNCSAIKGKEIKGKESKRNEIKEEMGKEEKTSNPTQEQKIISSSDLPTEVGQAPEITDDQEEGLIHFGRFVQMTNEHKQRIEELYGPEMFTDYCERINLYAGRMGKTEELANKAFHRKYKSCYYTMLNWLKRDNVPKKTANLPPPVYKLEPAGFAGIREYEKAYQQKIANGEKE